MEKEILFTKKEESWSKLPINVKCSVLKELIFELIEKNACFNKLSKNVTDLQTINKEFLRIYKTIFTKSSKYSFIYDLAKKINRVHNSPISYYSLAQALLSKNDFKKFDAFCNRESPNSLGYQLLEAINFIKTSKFKRLMLNGANLNIQSKEGSTILMLAIKHKRSELAELIIKNSTNVNIQSRQGYTALMYAVMFGQESIVQLLIDIGARTDLRDNNDSTALHLACKMNCEKIVNILVKANVDLNATDSDGDTPLIIACRQQNLKIVSMLLALNVFLNIKNKFGKTALIYASKNNSLSILRTLIKYNADLDIQDDKGNSALIYSASNNLTSITNELNMAGANLDLQNKIGRTALIEAVLYNQKQTQVETLGSYDSAIAKLLVANGADLSIKDIHNKTAYDYAKSLLLPHKKSLKPKKNKT